jgi:hypothetical protein
VGNFLAGTLFEKQENWRRRCIYSWHVSGVEKTHKQKRIAKTATNKAIFGEYCIDVLLLWTGD